MFNWGPHKVTLFASLSVIMAFAMGGISVAANAEISAQQISAESDLKNFENFMMAECGALVSMCNSLYFGGPKIGSIPELAAHIREAQKLNYSSPLTDDDFLAIFAYTETFYKPLNKSLRAHDDSMHAFTAVLNSALNKLPDSSGIVFRNDQIPESVLSEWRVGKTIVYDAFMSTSLIDVCDAPMTPFFCAESKQLLVIKSVHGKSIQRLAFIPSEREVLFRSGTTFKITAIKSTAAKMILFLEEL